MRQAAFTPIILSIAGSDCSGGAGIQADTKTISALGGYAATVITAITAQNTQGVQAVYPQTDETVRRQIESVMDDLPPHAVKIGMVHDANIVTAITDCLQIYRPPHVVYDPVMISTSGRRLMTEETIQAICEKLFPLCTLITPNLHETALLTGNTINSINDMEEAAQTLAHRYGISVLVKGGHLEGNEMCDVLFHRENIYRYNVAKIESHNLHGTGCTLSSAIATQLAYENPMEEAVRQAKQYVYQAINRGKNMQIGQGNGPLWHFF
ncbi:bifunctional hydroxymethylpyrimidine kinase/phosphomethylpyrimidine kinase [Bacteroides sp. CAG:633]|uniref:bifunctional hydroxymethylpyrimidine kinase/phosphomethylpyrimidine kinase n=1 Tax=Bacteroides sp. CAG:633 TaxID=1262744 RepID=UPI0025845350|nr:bifunctional hydroxymethylpyrimidine kinase/phosphomethylpyrimidine kinase [Bacteroides sp. CAG:633]